MTKTIKAAIAAAFAVTTLSGATALAQSNVFEFEVQRASLTNARAVQAEYNRLNDEAQRYCESLGLSAQTHVQICQRQVVGEVVRDSRLRALSQLHLQTLRRERSA